MTADSPDDDVIDLLTRQHDDIRARLAAIRDTGGEQRRTAFDELVRLLAVHECAEEQILHPIARHHGGAEVVEALLLEEEDVKTLLGELYAMGVDARWFDTRFGALETAVSRHLEHEERDEFPAVRTAAGPAELRGLAAAVRAAEAVAPDGRIPKPANARWSTWSPGHPSRSSTRHARRSGGGASRATADCSAFEGVHHRPEDALVPDRYQLPTSHHAVRAHSPDHPAGRADAGSSRSVPRSLRRTAGPSPYCHAAVRGPPAGLRWSPFPFDRKEARS